MIDKRTNSTYQDAQSFLEKYVIKYFPEMLYLPYPIRNGLNTILQNAIYSFWGLLLYLLALLSGAVGLTKLTKEGVPNWLSLILLIILLVIWVVNPLTVKRMTQRHLYKGKKSFLFIVLAVLLITSTIMELILRHDIDIHQFPFNMTFPLLVYYLLLCVVVIVSLLLAKYRSEPIDAQIDVSEYRNHWQETIHPKYIFRWLDEEIATLSGKSKEPHRVYKKLSPHISMEGKMNQGHFSGDTLQETEPVYYEAKQSAMFKKILRYTTIAGHSLFVIAAILLWINGKAEPLSFINIFHIVFYPALLTLFGFVLLVFTHTYWGEVHFVSYLIYFHGEGEYEEINMNDDGTAQSDQAIKTSFRPSLSLGKIITHTHATIGDKPLANTRYIASIEKEDDLMSEWIQEMSRVLDKKRIKHRGMINSVEQLNETTNELDTSSQQENEHIEQKTEQEENENIKHGDDTDNHGSNNLDG